MGLILMTRFRLSWHLLLCYVDGLSAPSFQFGELSLARLKLRTNLRNVFIELLLKSLLSLPSTLLNPLIFIN
jgi:hypothetical protein